MEYNPIGHLHPLGDVTALTPASANISTTSGSVVAFNENRRYLLMCNIGTQDAFLSFDDDAIVNEGIVLFRGESLELGRESESVKNGINAIVAANTTTIAFLEVE